MNISIPRIIKNWKYAGEISPADSGYEQNGFGHKVSRTEDLTYWKDAFLEFGLTPYQLEPLDKNFTAIHYLDGACTHTHKDVAPDGFVHVRCNVLLKKPKKGGHPIIDGHVLNVEENDLWILLASMERHGSIKISGSERMIYSFGALVDETQINKIIRH